MIPSFPSGGEAAQSGQNSVGLAPFNQLFGDRHDEIVEFGEILVMSGTLAQEFPDPFDRIQFGTVWRQEVQAQLAAVSAEEKSALLGAMIAGIVEYDDRAP